MSVITRDKSTIYGLNTDLANLVSADAAETARAQAAEQTNAAAISAETTRATAAEQNNATAVATETTRATGVEGSLGSLTTTDKSSLVNAVNENVANIHAETTRATAAEQVNAAAITAETARAETAEQANATAIANETARAEGVEGSLTTLTTVTKTNLVSAINENVTNLTNEISARQTADTSLSNRISVIESGAISGVVWQGKVATQTDLANLIEANLKDGWAYLTTDTNTVYIYTTGTVFDYKPTGWTGGFLEFADWNSITTLVNEETARAEGVEGSLSALVTTDKTNLVAAINSTLGAVNTETARATAAESAINTALTNEVTRAKAAEQANTTAIANEVTRAEGVEGNLSSLSTTAKSNLVSAINEVVGSVASAIVTAEGYADSTKLAKSANLSDLTDVVAARTNLGVYSTAQVDSAINTGGAIFFTETLVVASDKITLTHAPKNGVVFNFATVRNTDTTTNVTYDIPVAVTATAGGQEFQLYPDTTGQFDGKSVVIQYAYTA